MGKQRFMNIDALRAIAAMAVLVQHFFGDVVREAVNPLAPLVPIFNASLDNFDLGRFGVILFFLISGFVVPFSIRGSRPLRRFAISRFFRLYPALWLAVLLLTILLAWEGSLPSKATILANLTMMPSFFGERWLSGIYWTLSIELVFYFLCAFLYRSDALYRPRMITAFSFVLITSTVAPILVRMFSDIHLPIQYIGLHVSFLFCGLLIRMAFVDKVKGAGLGAVFITFMQFSALVTIGDFSLDRGDGFFMIGKMPIILAYIAAFASFAISVKIGKPESNTLSFMGAISYSIYLFHGVVALLIYRYFPLTGEFNNLLIGLVSAVLTIVFSWSVYRLLEQPMIAVGRKYTSSKQENLIKQIV